MVRLVKDPPKPPKGPNAVNDPTYSIDDPEGKHEPSRAWIAAFVVAVCIALVIFGGAKLFSWLGSLPGKAVDVILYWIKGYR